MIHVNSFTPFGEKNSVTLKSLEKDFSQRINRGLNPFDRISMAYLSNGEYSMHLTNSQKNCLREILMNYEGIILGNPTKLARIISHYEKAGYNRLLFDSRTNKTTAFGNFVLGLFGYTSRFRSKEEKGIWLAMKLNIKVCPYCNSQYTLFVKNADNSGLAKFQFDHFFSKHRYPYLSLSLYNLIPSCASCNHKKGSELMDLKRHFHPYINSIHGIAKFKITYPADIRRLNVHGVMKMQEEDISIDFRPRSKKHVKSVLEHDRIYDIGPLYRRHKDIAHEILIKSILNNRYYQKGLRSIRGLFPDKRTLLKYVLGNYMREEEISKRPLAKLYQDLAKQLKLI